MFETEAGYTAYFNDNDPRERNATYVDTDKVTKKLGDPLPEVANERRSFHTLMFSCNGCACPWLCLCGPVTLVCMVYR